MMTQPSTTPEHFTIADTCVLVALERNRLSTSRRAERSVEDRIRQGEGDNSITVIRHLFKDGPVRDAIRVEDDAYRAHKDMTAAWIDRGPRLLHGSRMEEYASMIEKFKNQLAPLAAEVKSNWYKLVDDDVRRRQTAGAKGVSTDEYPTLQDVMTRDLFSLEWRPMPVPKDDDFRVQVPQYIKDRHQKYLDLAVQQAQEELMQRMLKPLQAAAEKLSVPVGEKGSIFRDTLIGNLKLAVEQARSLNLGGDSTIAGIADEIDNMIQQGQLEPDALRNAQQSRSDAAAKLHSLAGRFAGL